MVLIARKFTRAERAQVRRNASEVRRRRNRLGLLQKDIDFAAGVAARTVERIERRNFDFRSMPPEDERIGLVLNALDKLEKNGAISRRPSFVDHMRAKLGRRINPSRKPKTTNEAVTLTATLKRCPEQDVWITQGGCVGRMKIDPICQSRRNGKGCPGVKRRRLETKDIEVDYSPPTEVEIEVAQAKPFKAGRKW